MPKKKIFITWEQFSTLRDRLDLFPNRHTDVIRTFLWELGYDPTEFMFCETEVVAY